MHCSHTRISCHARSSPPSPTGVLLSRMQIPAIGLQVRRPSSRHTATTAKAAATGERQQTQKLGFPPGPAGDQSLALLSDPLACISRLKREHGPCVGLSLGGQRVVLVADPAAARQVLIDQADVFVKAGTAFFPGSSLTGQGLLVSDGAVWKRQRRLSNPAFRKAAVDRYASVMVSEAQQLLDGPFAAAAAASVSKQQQQQQQRPLQAPAARAGGAAAAAAGVRDVYADFNQLTLNITLSALFSIRSDNFPPTADSSGSSGSGSGSSGRAAMIVAAVQKAFSYFAARGATAMVVPEWVPTPDNLAFRQAVRQLDSIVYGIIDNRAAAMKQQQQQSQQVAAASSNSSSDSTSDSHSSSSSSNSSSSSSGGGNTPDLLQALMDSVDEAGVPMSRTALRDELMTLLVAGQETSAILLGWAAALLAHNPKAQAAAAAEAAAVLGGSNGRDGSTGSSGSSHGGSSNGSSGCSLPSLSDVSQLPYVTAVVLEALRLWSPAYMVGRCANRAVELVGGHQLPAGTTCLVSPYLLHRDPTRWKEPTAFRPERWLHLLPQQQQQQQQQGGCPFGHQDNSQQQQQPQAQQVQQEQGGCPFGGGSAGNQAATAGQTTSSSSNSNSVPPTGAYSFSSVLKDLGPNGAFVPFGAGPRNCIGTGFAMTEAVLVLAMLLQRYELQPVSPAAGFPRPQAMLTLRPEAVPLRILRRSQQQQRAAGGRVAAVVAGTGVAEGAAAEAVTPVAA